ncbi:hypothetical protein [Brevibacillus sp. Leaf182]|uniref:hypothetical protein n=1 Tax=Brevibacillus sp. Leaf182 TaxID=1736290 RepID=UPI0006FCEA9F|nr:hypothetical protein [Brevibacillus sp. Leaf182]RAT97934.1 hypothetical protein ASG16_009815 [Brevibacillus sp. Leaf182]
MKVMKINYEDTQSISNAWVRWYLSSQIVWIGKEKNYNEIEKLQNTSFGSFKWLWSDADTLLFQQDNLEFIGAVIKLNEPIIVNQDKINISLIEEKNGNIKLSENKNFNCKLSDFTEYFVEDDTILCYSEKWNRIQPSIEIKISADFSFVIQNDELMGIVLYKASWHLLPDGIHVVEENTHIHPDLRVKLCRFFELIAIMDNDLTQIEESELKNSLLEIYEEVSCYGELSYKALRDTIFNVLDYM